jgi:hypothetical protein
MYDDLKCQNANLIIFSYEQLEICENNIDENNCIILNENANFSMLGLCGDNSLEYTKTKFKNDFIYTEIYDYDCLNKTGAVAIALNKCISYMNTVYIKITKDKNTLNSKTYSDIKCQNVIKDDKQMNDDKQMKDDFQKSLNLQYCSDKIYTKDGLFKNPNIADNINKKNDDTNIQNNTNNEKNTLILTFSLMIIMIIALANHY